MHCPKCGAAEKTRVKVCSSCGEAFASQDLIELHQLEFLMKETSSWNVAEGVRLPYKKRLLILQERLKGLKLSELKPQVEPATTISAGKAALSTTAQMKANIRSGPGPDYQIYGKLDKGASAEVIGTSPGRKWLAVRVPTSMSPDGRGWVAANFTDAAHTENLPVVQAPSAPPKAAPKPAAVPKPPAPKEKVPFDQWLLSERNIKFALYGGGLLLVIAGIIFIGVNWTRIPGPGKFAITLLVTGLMYLGGYLLFQRPAYRIGGVALLAIASGFLTLNFAVLQIYVMGPRGLLDEAMWMIASPLCLLVYLLTAYWTKSRLFTCICVLAAYSCATAALALLDAPELLYVLVYAVLAFLMLLLAHRLRKTSLADFTYSPLYIISQIVTAVTFIGSFTILVSGNSIFIENPGSLWIGMITVITGTAFYILNAYWSRKELFVYASILAFSCAVFGLLALFEALFLVYSLVFACLAIVCLALSVYSRNVHFLEFTSQPLLVAAQIIVPITLVFGLIGLWAEMVFSINEFGNPWLAISVLILGVVFYGLTDAFYKWLAARWVAAFAFPITFTFFMLELNVSDTTAAVLLMVSALIYLGIGYWVQRQDERQYSGLPVFTAAYCVAIFVTGLAVTKDTSDLVQVLIGDVALLAISAYIHRSYWWVYGSVWLFMLPAYLTIGLYVPEIQYQGLLMGLLGINYLVAGYLLGRRELRLGGPFLTAAAFLSALVIGMTWVDPLIASLMLAAVAVLYILAALWLGWTWLLFPALLSVNLALLTINSLAFNLQYQEPFWRTLVISYFILGAVVTLCARACRHFKLDAWSWPLYIAGTIGLTGAYLASFYFAGWLVVSISVVFSILLLSFAWMERAFIESRLKISALTYIAIGVIFIGHFFVLDAVGGDRFMQIWPAFSAGLCAVFVGSAWLLRKGPLEEIYALPLRFSGLLLMAIPCIGSIIYTSITGSFEPVLVAVTFGIAGITYTGDAALRRVLRLAYLGLGTFLVVIWALLYAFEIREPQAYIFPFGLALLGVGWNERLRGRMNMYRLLSMAGMVILMGSALVQSITSGNFWYAVLLAVEGILFIAFGVYTQSRCFVQFGTVALVANAFIQLGPGFVDLPRWVQIGVTGGLLLIIGLTALFKREDILETRSKLTDDWRQWSP